LGTLRRGVFVFGSTKPLFLLAALMAALMAALTFGPARAEPVTVFAAASTASAMDEVVARFNADAQTPGRAAYAASSTLAKQIANGAPASVYLSANAAWMDYLEAEGDIVPDSRGDLLGNTLVLVAAPTFEEAIDLKDPASLPEALGEARLAVGDPDHVPAGQYAMAALTSLGAWPELEGRLARASDARATLALVARGEAPLGIVYETDAAISPEVRVVGRFPAENHPPIVYPVAAVAGREAGAAERFLAFLRGPEARRVFERHGFTILPPPRPAS
jgi:molybdate transport system substrate-binding protein